MIQPFLELSYISKIFPTPKGPFVALKDVALKIRKGEFIALLGHSGCGKSTLLNIVAGLSKASAGGVILEGKETDEPGPDRMVVFQNYALLPWLTAYENVHLAVRSTMPGAPESERRSVAERYLALVGLAAKADKRPGEISGGQKQRVAIARALATRPKVLLLDEPFGALDALTREEMQEEVLKIWEADRTTVLMVTHEIDEAILMADRIVMMTNGPAATIGEVFEVPFARPRSRAEILEDPAYYTLRNRILEFLYDRFGEPVLAD
ncbi:ABC transporter ATP-binding protein [Gloeobacter morelensis]|uniref:ATP-binding cassette domain-containing protein n=1 Tax=Gloeobacter morelensis MG652769 TaxID=2781736 RepID=A0ABY3PGY4_9CYAN|nr:nitrate ABC transporter ATP-binding protein [Gloeobacter morelensis]UFP92886.1 ATP-binding cassette domain-containing protein [Gloeobacter morelensis MG652769]